MPGRILPVTTRRKFQWNWLPLRAKISAQSSRALSRPETYGSGRDVWPVASNNRTPFF